MKSDIQISFPPGSPVFFFDFCGLFFCESFNIFAVSFGSPLFLLVVFFHSRGFCFVLLPYLTIHIKRDLLWRGMRCWFLSVNGRWWRVIGFFWWLSKRDSRKDGIVRTIGLVRITLCYPNFNGSHFGFPPS